MVKKIKGIKIELIIISIVLFALGLFLVIYPELSQLIICKAVGIALCVWGVLRLIVWLKRKYLVRLDWYRVFHC